MESELISLLLLAVAVTTFAGALWVLARVQESRQRGRRLELENDQIERQSP